MKFNNLFLLALIVVLVLPCIASAAGPTSAFYMIPTDKMVYSLVPYDAMVYQDGTYTVAVNRTGAIISSVLTSSHTDNIPIQAAVNAGNKVCIQGANYGTNSTITLNTGNFIFGDGMKTAIWNYGTGDVFYAINKNSILLRDFYVNMNGKNGRGINLTGDIDHNYAHYLEDVIVISSNNDGIAITGGTTSKIINSISEYNIVAGLKLSGCRYIYVSQLLSEVNGVAVSLIDTTSSDISSSELNSFPVGISLVNSTHNTISGIHFLYGQDGSTGITLDSNSAFNTISGSSIHTAYRNTTGILSAGYRNVFTNNVIDGWPINPDNRMDVGIKVGSNDIASSNQILYTILAINATGSVNATITNNQFLATTDITGGTTPITANNNWEVYP